MKVEFDEYTINYDDSQEAKDRIFNLALQWFVGSEMFSVEILSQCDHTYTEGPELIFALADNGFKFKMTEKEWSIWESLGTQKWEKTNLRI